MVNQYFVHILSPVTDKCPFLNLWQGENDRRNYLISLHLGYVAIWFDTIVHNIYTDWLCWGLMKRQLFWVIMCRLPVKGRREIEGEMKERDRGERKMNERVETEEIITFPLYPFLLQG